MDFEWNEQKNRSNLAKHGIAFEDATGVFDDPLQLSEPARSVGAEARQLVIGRVNTATLSVVYTTRGQTSDGEALVRIISARPASKKERQKYAGQ